jgi:hypothetical protein
LVLGKQLEEHIVLMRLGRHVGAMVVQVGHVSAMETFRGGLREWLT